MKNTYKYLVLLMVGFSLCATGGSDLRKSAEKKDKSGLRKSGEKDKGGLRRSSEDEVQSLDILHVQKSPKIERREWSDHVRPVSPGAYAGYACMGFGRVPSVDRISRTPDRPYWADCPGSGYQPY